MPEGSNRKMTDAEILAAANARYEAFRAIFPRVLADIGSATNLRLDQMATESRVSLVGSAAETAARLVAGDAPESSS
jgi:hypothetical protein